MNNLCITGIQIWLESPLQANRAHCTSSWAAFWAPELWFLLTAALFTCLKPSLYMQNQTTLGRSDMLIIKSPHNGLKAQNPPYTTFIFRFYSILKSNNYVTDTLLKHKQTETLEAVLDSVCGIHSGMSYMLFSRTNVQCIPAFQLKIVSAWEH